MLSIFDLDHTLVQGNLSFLFGKYLYRKKVFSFSTMLLLTSYYIRQKYFHMPINQLHDQVFTKLFKGQSSLYINSLIPSFLNATLDKIIYQPTLLKLQEAQERKECTLLLSSSPQFLVEPVAKMLKFTRWESTHYQVNEQQNFSSITRYINGPEKALFAKELAKQLMISSKEITAYTDSHDDLPLLEFVGNPIAVRPSHKLNKISINRGWPIL